ncbi:MAG: glycosyltransferase [Verrucomicrobia bacterium]|mgnify:CR=1 FL=1|nr:glycosyltransferase [Verrucomicrobiota bacterium]
MKFAPNRYLLWIAALALCVYAILAFAWVGQPPSNQEMLANVARALDIQNGWSEGHGPAWWTSNFLQGSSLAPLISHTITSLWLLVASALGGIFAGPKLGGFLCLLLAILGVYGWIRRLTASDIAAAISALAFMLTASIYVRLGGVEHMVFVTAFAVIPYVLWSATAMAERSTFFNALLFGGVLSFLLLSYGKAGALLAPALFIYLAIVILWKQRTWHVAAAPWAVVILVVSVLGVLPNLPAVREMRFATLFEIAPFQGWLRAFSLKSSLLWLDRDGLLSSGMGAAFAPTTAQGGNYLGIVPAIILGAILLLKPSSLYASVAGRACRLCIALFLFLHWLSFGPFSVLTGQLQFLKLAVMANDLAVPISWVLFLIQPWIIFSLLPKTLAGRTAIGAVLSAIYLIVPGFRLIGWLPFYADLRAPHDFSQVIGIFFLAGATGAAGYLLLQALPARFPRRIAAIAALALALADTSPYFKPFFQSAVDRQTFSDFQAAQDFLKKAPIGGWVFPLSGRYFYMLTPELSGRGLNNEAFNAYLMQRGVSQLQSIAWLSPDYLQAYLRIGGIAYILIDKKDPDLGEGVQQRFTKMLPTAFENDHFLILENPETLFPAYLAQEYVDGEIDPAEMAQVSLRLAKVGAVAVLPQDEPIPGRIGHLEKDGYVLDEKSHPTATRLEKVSPETRFGYRSITLSAMPSPGWLTLPLAYHPDWQATIGGRAAGTDQIDGAFLGVYVPQAGEKVEFRFVPPWWYGATLALSALGWLGWLGVMAAGLLPKSPFPRLKSLLDGDGISRTPVGELKMVERPAISRAVVIIPTYNEIESLPTTLSRVLAADARADVLIVDDNSPDGTGDWVRKHDLFGKRVHLLARTGKLGLGSAYRDGFKWAIERGYEACLEMDADLSHDPDDVPHLIDALNAGADLAVGSRYLNGVRVMNWSEHRLLLSTTASRYVRTVTGLPLTDATSGFKAIRTSVLRPMDWKRFKTEGYGFQVELHYFLWQAGARLVEVPIVFTERRDGKTKMTLGIAIEAALRTLQLGLATRSSAQTAKEPTNE